MGWRHGRLASGVSGGACSAKRTTGWRYSCPVSSSVFGEGKTDIKARPSGEWHCKFSEAQRSGGPAAVPGGVKRAQGSPGKGCWGGVGRLRRLARSAGATVCRFHGNKGSHGMVLLSSYLPLYTYPYSQLKHESCCCMHTHTLN